jgi:peptidyl-prolyl cis-trans isomerase B (cyclophilin B)
MVRCFATLLLFLSLALPAAAQLTPERTYFGVNRPIIVSVAVPKEVSGPAEIQILEPVTAKLIARATTAAGNADLAKFFPELWTVANPRVLYAQLVVGTVKVGPALVLQPMLAPVQATIDARIPGAPIVTWPTPDKRDKTYSGMRVYVDQHVLLETDAGPIRLQLRPDAAPNTCWFFRELVAGGFYTDITFHRIIALDGTGNPFVIQTGDPTGTGSGGPGFHFDLEQSLLQHDFGVVSMARDPKRVDTNGSQFFIGLSREGTRVLDGSYCAFAQAVDGAEAIAAIAKTPVSGPEGKPIKAPKLKSAKLIDAPPYGEGPKPVQVGGRGER